MTTRTLQCRTSGAVLTNPSQDDTCIRPETENQSTAYVCYSIFVLLVLNVLYTPRDDIALIVKTYDVRACVRTSNSLVNLHYLNELFNDCHQPVYSLRSASQDLLAATRPRTVASRASRLSASAARNFIRDRHTPDTFKRKLKDIPVVRKPRREVVRTTYRSNYCSCVRLLTSCARVISHGHKTRAHESTGFFFISHVPSRLPYGSPHFKVSPFATT